MVKIIKYQVRLWTDQNPMSYDARIDCDTDTAENKKVFFYFFRDGVVMEENVYTGSMWQASYRISKLPIFIDILRNEKPVYYYFNSTSKKGYLTTVKEEAGKGDI